MTFSVKAVVDVGGDLARPTAQSVEAHNVQDTDVTVRHLSGGFAGAFTVISFGDKVNLFVTAEHSQERAEYLRALGEQLIAEADVVAEKVAV